MTDATMRLLAGDCREVLPTLPADSIHCCVTSPPYWGMRDYGHPGQIGMEPTLAEHVETMVDVFRGVRRVLRPDGTLWLNLGDSYGSGGSGGPSKKQDSNREPRFESCGSKDPSHRPKDRLMIPARVANLWNLHLHHQPGQPLEMALSMPYQGAADGCHPWKGLLARLPPGGTSRVSADGLTATIMRGGDELPIRVVEQDAAGAPWGYVRGIAAAAGRSVRVEGRVVYIE